jgi:hypothetical protein
MTEDEWTALLTEVRGNDVDRAVEAARKIEERSTEADIPRLRQLVQDAENFFVRECLAAPLAKLGDFGSLPLLLHAMQRGTDEGYDNDSLSSIIAEIIETHPREAEPLLAEMARTSNDSEREWAAWALGFLPGELAAEHLKTVMQDRCNAVRQAAAVSTKHASRQWGETYPVAARRLRSVTLFASVLICLAWGGHAITSYPLIVIADSDLGAGAMRTYRDAGTMFFWSLAVIILSTRLVVWPRFRIALAFVLVGVFMSILFESNATPIWARWPSLVVLGWSVVLALTEMRWRLTSRDIVILAVAIPSMLVTSDWLARGYLGHTVPPRVVVKERVL